MSLPIIMAGGSSSRLWPLSRQLYPKQFLTLTSKFTLLQDTFLRLEGIAHQPPLVICNEAHRFIVAEQLRQQNLSHSGIILEPVGRNTATAIALSALHAILKEEDPLLLVLAADHAYKVLRFVEKPDLATAKQYLEAGGYDWNSGLFLFKASRYLEELNQHRPDILIACQKALLRAS